MTLAKFKSYFSNNLLFRPIYWILIILENERIIYLAHKKELNISRLEKSQKLQINEWNRINGDQTLRIDYPLNEKSIVFDVGGYLGTWASDIYSKYSSHIYIFEPVPEFYHLIQSRFSNNINVKIFKFGLGSKNATLSFQNEGDRSSFNVKRIEHNSASILRIVDILEVVQSENLDKIDLIKINIEGGEYELLTRIIDSNLIKKIDFIQVQFHDLNQSSYSEMNELRQKLAASHYPTYRYEFLWESWKRKELSVTC